MFISWSKISFVYKVTGLKFHRRVLFRSTSLCSQLQSNSPVGQCQNYSSQKSEIRKKDCSQPLGRTYDPALVESGWYDWWLDRGFFSPPNTPNAPRTGPQHTLDHSAEVFSLLLPPPNVTGQLHLGHALTGAIQDAIVRWHRMRGHTTVWVPGMDHAGIATHAVVERKLWREKGQTRHDLGRDKFIQEIWKWKQEHGDVIRQQTIKLGLSLDWSREYFTMDESRCDAVTEAFCQLYHKGLIFKDRRMVNWSPSLRSTVSDIEVNSIKLEGSTLMRVPGEEEEVEFGVLTRFAYPILDSEEFLVVSTTRLETMLADTAVAVHPSDPRYSHLVGQRVVHPVIKGKQLPIIADSFVDMDFGTGVVKITPGHDHTDYEVSQRHKLAVEEIMNDDGTLHDNLPLIGGQTRFQARRKLREALCLLGYYSGERDNPSSLPVCSRSGDIVEPRLKQQWFLDVREMAQKAQRAVESGELQVVPDYNSRIWQEWLTNTKDWCLSRQLWWGHRIPVYTCQITKESVCARSKREACEILACRTGRGLDEVCLEQDEDVLDTWFSSSLLPLSALGWPHQTADLKQFFPQKLMETGQDILFFWVARMVMISLELTKQLPFNKILLHGMLRDAHGRKMSKSLGNVIDPLDVIGGISLQDLHKRLESGNLDPGEKKQAMEGQLKDFPAGIVACGADALRFTLLSYNVKNVDINFNVEHAESMRRFCNKIWQAFKFILSKLGPQFVPATNFSLTGQEDSTDLWILGCLGSMVRTCHSGFQSRDLHIAVEALRYFWYQELCDVYLESVKPVFLEDDMDRQDAVRQILHLCAETFVRAAAPFLPFLCEELYQRLPARDLTRSESVCIAQYPVPEKYQWEEPILVSSMELTRNLIYHVQKLRKEHNIFGTKSPVFIQSGDPKVLSAVKGHMTCLLALSRSSGVTLMTPGDTAPPRCVSANIQPDTCVFVELQGTVSTDLELQRLTEQQSELRERLTKLKAKLDSLKAQGKEGTRHGLKLQGKLTKAHGEMEKLANRMRSLSEISAR